MLYINFIIYDYVYFLKRISFLKFNTKWLCAKSGIKYYQFIWVTRMVLIFSKLSQLWDYSDSCPIWNYRLYNQSLVQSWKDLCWYVKPSDKLMIKRRWITNIYFILHENTRGLVTWQWGTTRRHQRSRPVVSSQYINQLDNC